MASRNPYHLASRRDALLGEASETLDRAKALRRDLTTVEAKSIDSTINEIKALDAQISSIKKEAAMHAREATPVGADGLTMKGADGRTIPLLRKGQSFASLAERSEADEVPLASLIKAMVTNDFRGLPNVAKSMSAGTGVSGGLLIGQEVSAQIVDLVRAKARAFQAGVLTMPMDHGQLTMARLDSDVTPGWRGEHQAIASSDASFGAINLSAKCLAVNVKISLELAQFAANANNAIMHSVSEAMALAMDKAILSGSGVGAEPNGIVNTQGVATKDVGSHYLTETGYGWDPFGAALGKLRDVNLDESSDNISLLVSPGIATAQDRLVDTLGRSIVPPPYMENIPRYVTSQIPVAAGTPNTSWALMGKFDSAVVGMAQNLTLEISREAADANGSAWGNGEIWIRALAWMDVGVLRPSHFIQLQNIGLT